MGYGIDKLNCLSWGNYHQEFRSVVLCLIANIVNERIHLIIVDKIQSNDDRQTSANFHFHPTNRQTESDFLSEERRRRRRQLYW